MQTCDAPGHVVAAVQGVLDGQPVAPVPGVSPLVSFGGSLPVAAPVPASGHPDLCNIQLAPVETEVVGQQQTQIAVQGRRSSSP
jgi:hypothetical protein